MTIQTQMIRHANVQVREGRDPNDNAPIALARVFDTDSGQIFDAHFPKSSRVSKALTDHTPDQITDRLNGGHFFFGDFGNEGGMELIDFRDGHYNGFVHTDHSIERMKEVIGITQRDDVQSRFRNKIVNTNVFLGAMWDNHPISVDQYRDGGEFNSQLHFLWNPFERAVSSAFMLVRLICANGMVGLTSLLNSRIPLINRWEEHLEIANNQIQTKVDNIVKQRIEMLGRYQAPVSAVGLIADHARMRLNDLPITATEHDRSRLMRIADIAQPEIHLGNLYQEAVFTDQRIGAQMPSHLTGFDAFNMATELSSHTPPSADSSTNALDRAANRLLFDWDPNDMMVFADKSDRSLTSPFSSSERAFFGDVDIVN